MGVHQPSLSVQEAIDANYKHLQQAQDFEKVEDGYRTICSFDRCPVCGEECWFSTDVRGSMSVLSDTGIYCLYVGTHGTRIFDHKPEQREAIDSAPNAPNVGAEWERAELDR
jgi:hypothetical protein